VGKQRQPALADQQTSPAAGPDRRHHRRFGARLAMGCNLAAFFTGIPMFSLHAWAFMLATVGGA